MTDLPFAIVGFDLDGTLLDTSGDLAAAVNHALESAGRAPLPVAAIKPMIGGGARHMLAQGMNATGGYTEADLDAAHRRLLAYYEANMVVHTVPFPHAIDALDMLAAKGVTLGVMTNKVERYAVQVLDALGLAHRFAALVGGDTLPVGKPDPAPIHLMVDRCGGGPGSGKRSAFVGDSIYDVQAAKAAGLPVIGCSFGFLDRAPEALGADAVINSFDELVPTLARLSAT